MRHRRPVLWTVALLAVLCGVAGLVLVRGRSATPDPAPAPAAGRSIGPPAPSGSRPPGFPAAATTGWAPTGVTLDPLPCTSAQVLEVSEAGTVIDGRDIACNVLVTADDVTITRSRVTAGAPFAIRQLDTVHGLTVTDTQVIGTAGCEVGVGFSHWTGSRLDISGCVDGARTEQDVTITDSWIHGLRRGSEPDPPHNDGIQATGGSDVVIRHNRIENPGRQTSVILIGGEFGAPSNWLVEDNYLDGGNFTIYLDPKGTNRTIRDNVFTRRYVYGPTSVEGQVRFAGNTYPDGSPVRN